jgi:hypothetical protein
MYSNSFNRFGVDSSELQNSVCSLVDDWPNRKVKYTKPSFVAVYILKVKTNLKHQN